MNESRVVLAGSTKEAASNATLVGKTDPSTNIDVTVILKPKSAIDGPALSDHVATPVENRIMPDRAAFVQQYGADDAAINAVKDYAAACGLSVKNVDAGRRVVELSGSVANAERAFGTELQDFTRGSLTFRGRQGPVTLPAGIAPLVEAVLGLDNRPAASPRVIHPRVAQKSYYPREIASLYQFPTGDGAGEAVAIIELGGAYDATDLKTYFAAALAPGTPAPKVSTVSVSPGLPVAYGSADDDEVMLDIEMIGGIAPGANIVVYFAENTDQGFYQAVSQAVHDPNTSAVSISWGSKESDWTAQTMTAWETLAQSAALLSVSVFAAAGDHGSSDQQTSDSDFDGQRHADFPGTAPHITSCGGTNLQGSSGTITGETVWNNQDGWATGGGVSVQFPVPTWQAGLIAESKTALTMRGVPDIAGDADPNSGIAVRVHGQDLVSGGTSAVAPLWAALTALLNQRLKSKVGFFTPMLYATTACNDITVGDNGANSVAGFSAKAGWDACTGLGSPNGAKIQASLTAVTSAGSKVQQPV
ncbi:MAG TPA: S53 family peptidase [Candidatus Eremiobacteraceae bacterium]